MAPDFKRRVLGGKSQGKGFRKEEGLKRRVEERTSNEVTPNPSLLFWPIRFEILGKSRLLAVGQSFQPMISFASFIQLAVIIRHCAARASVAIRNNG